jgi:hypothetical protein
MTLLYLSNYFFVSGQGGYGILDLADFVLSFVFKSMLNFVFLTGMRLALLQDIKDREHGLQTLDLFDITRNHVVLMLKRLLTVLLVVIASVESNYEGWYFTGGVATDIVFLALYPFFALLSMCGQLALVAHRAVWKETAPPHSSIVRFVIATYIASALAWIALVIGVAVGTRNALRKNHLARFPILVVTAGLGDLFSVLHVLRLRADARDDKPAPELTIALLTAQHREETTAEHREEAKAEHREETTAEA